VTTRLTAASALDSESNGLANKHSVATRLVTSRKTSPFDSGIALSASVKSSPKPLSVEPGDPSTRQTVPRDGVDTTNSNTHRRNGPKMRTACPSRIDAGSLVNRDHQEHPCTVRAQGERFSVDGVRWTRVRNVGLQFMFRHYSFFCIDSRCPGVCERGALEERRASEGLGKMARTARSL
jgi:hypothetical protein